MKNMTTRLLILVLVTIAKQPNLASQSPVTPGLFACRLITHLVTAIKTNKQASKPTNKLVLQKLVLATWSLQSFSRGSNTEQLMWHRTNDGWSPRAPSLQGSVPDSYMHLPLLMVFTGSILV
jgi:hypothetical protein